MSGFKQEKIEAFERHYEAFIEISVLLTGQKPLFYAP
jgi:hypothetical protein